MNDRFLKRLLLTVFCLIQIQATDAQKPTDPWYGRSPRPRDFEPFNAPSARFAIEVPKDWQVVPGYAHILFTVTEKTRNNQSAAAIILEHLQLRSALTLTPSVAEVELTSIREREPSGTEFSQQIKDIGGRRFIFLQYSRPGHVGPDRVTQYSILAGSVMYRLMCVVSAPQLAKYQPICAHVAASFSVRDPASK